MKYIPTHIRVHTIHAFSGARLARISIFSSLFLVIRARAQGCTGPDAAHKPTITMTSRNIRRAQSLYGSVIPHGKCQREIFGVHVLVWRIHPPWMVLDGHGHISSFPVCGYCISYRPCDPVRGPSLRLLALRVRAHALASCFETLSGGITPCARALTPYHKPREISAHTETIIGVCVCANSSRTHTQHS